MTKSVPRISQKNVPEAVEKASREACNSVEFSKDKFLEKLDEINDNYNAQYGRNLIRAKEDFYKFFKDRLELLEGEDSSMRPTEDCKHLVESSKDFEERFFDLLKRKSRENFTYFNNVLELVKSKTTEGDRFINKDVLEEEIIAASNTVSGPIFYGILRDLGVIQEMGDKEVCLSSETLEMYEKGSENYRIDQFFEENNKEVTLDQFRKFLSEQLGYSTGLEDKIRSLREEDKISKTNHGGKTHVMRVNDA